MGIFVALGVILLIVIGVVIALTIAQLGPLTTKEIPAKPVALQERHYHGQVMYNKFTKKWDWQLVDKQNKAVTWPGLHDIYTSGSMLSRKGALKRVERAKRQIFEYDNPHPWENV